MTRDEITPGGNKPLSKQEQDFIDHQNELAGADVGRQPRFLSEPKTASAIETRKKKDRERLSRLLELLQHDPEYAALYSQTIGLLGRAEVATAMALEKAEEALNQAAQELDAITDRANTLPDGTKVFRDANGVTRTADGEIIDDQRLDTIHHRPDAPSYGEYLAAKKATEQAQKRIDELRRYQVDGLGDARHRMTDPDNPLTKDELKDIQKDIKEKAPSAIQAELAPDMPTHLPSMETSAATTIPKL